MQASSWIEGVARVALALFWLPLVVRLLRDLEALLARAEQAAPSGGADEAAESAVRRDFTGPAPGHERLRINPAWHHGRFPRPRAGFDASPPCPGRRLGRGPRVGGTGRRTP